MKKAPFSIFVFLLSAATNILAGQAERMDTVYVTASRAAANDIDTEFQTGRVTVITKETFDTTVETVADVLSKEAGVQIRQVGGLGSFSPVNMRGSSSSQVNVYVDGVLINGAYGGAVDLSQFTLGNVEQIEIYRGNTPIQLGASGIGGAIHIRTSKGSVEPTKSLTLGYGSFETQKAALSIADSVGTSDVMLALDYLASDNDFRLVNDGGTPLNPTDDFSDRRRNADLNQASFLFSLNRPLSEDVESSLILQYLDKDKQLEDRRNIPSNNASFDTELTSIQGKLDYWSSDQTSFTIKGFYSERVEVFKDESSFIGLQSNDETGTTDSYGSQIFASHLMGSHQITINTEFKQEDYLVENSIDNSAVEYGRFQITSGVQTEWVSSDNRWLINAGGRAFYVDNDTGQFDRTDVDDTHFGWQLGLLRQLGAQVDLRTNLSNDIRLPTLFELYGDRGFALGNEELIPESAINFDVGISYRPKDFSASATLFYREIDDAIVTIFNARGIGKAENISSSEVIGLELEFDYKVSEKTHISLKSTSQESENTSNTVFSGNQLPGISRFENYFALRHRLRSIELKLEHEHRSGGFYDSAENEAILDLNQINLSAKWRGQNRTVEASLNNVTNESTEQFNGFVGPGRQAFITFKQQF